MNRSLRGRIDKLSSRVDGVAKEQAVQAEPPPVIFFLPCKCDQATGRLLERPRREGLMQLYDARPKAVQDWVAARPGSPVPWELWLAVDLPN